MLARASLSLAYPLLFYVLTANAVNQGYLPSSVQEVPYSTGFLITLDENEQVPGYGDCTQGDEPITPFCSGGLISEGVFLTAAHCFENGRGDAVSDGSLDLSNLRVGLGAMYPYRNNDGSCSGNLLDADDGIYKVKAVYIHKGFTVIPNEYNYLNPKTGRRAEGAMGLDHMDIAVVYLDECTTPVSGKQSRHGKIAGSIYPPLSQMWAPGAAGSITNTGPGMSASFWGYGESEDDRPNLPKAVRRADWNLSRATTSFTTQGSANVEKIWSNCDWLEDNAPVWNSGTHSATSGYSGGDSSFPNKVKAAPFLACTLRNPNDPNVKSLCRDQTSRNACTASKSMSGKSFCKWRSNACEIDEDTVGGIGLVTYPSSGGGDSGAAAWHLEQGSDINDRDQQELVHIGIVFAATVLYPAWDQVVRTDYFQNWLAQIIDRDSCAALETKEYFVGFDNYPFTRAPQAQWNNLSQDYVGKVKGVSGAQALSRLPKRGNAGNWETDNGNDGDASPPTKSPVTPNKPSLRPTKPPVKPTRPPVRPPTKSPVEEDDENENEDNGDDDSNHVFCPGVTDFCDCDADCVENRSFCACDEAQKCCGADNISQEEESSNSDASLEDNEDPDQEDEENTPSQSNDQTSSQDENEVDETSDEEEQNEDSNEDEDENEVDETSEDEEGNDEGSPDGSNEEEEDANDENNEEDEEENSQDEQEEGGSQDQEGENSPDDEEEQEEDNEDGNIQESPDDSNEEEANGEASNENNEEDEDNVFDNESSDDDECKDDETFGWGKKNRGCAWVASRPPKAIARFCRRRMIHKACPITCGTNCLPCQDDPSFRFRGREDRNCKWVRRTVRRRPEICNQFSKGTKVRDACKRACGSC